MTTDADSVRQEGPTGQCFVCAKHGYFALEPAEDVARGITVTHFADGYFSSLVVYDAAGRVWRVEAAEPVVPITRFKKLLARTVVDSVISVRLTWARPQAYAFGDLREAFLRAAEEDDDNLTQFVEREELLQRIRNCGSFAALAEVYEWAGTDTSES